MTPACRGDGEDRSGMFFTHGRLEVHHPCEGHIKAQVMVMLPDSYLQWERMRDLVQQVFAALGIPADETYEAHFASPTQQAGVIEPTDRNGVTDKINVT